MPRLDEGRQQQLEPERIRYAAEKIEGLGFQIDLKTTTMIQFQHNGYTVKFWPYSVGPPANPLMMVED